MPNCHWYESQSKTSRILTGYLKPKESEEKRENSNDLPPRWYRYNRCDNTSINRWENFLTVTTLPVGQGHMHSLLLYNSDPINYCLWWDM